MKRVGRGFRAGALLAGLALAVAAAALSVTRSGGHAARSSPVASGQDGRSASAPDAQTGTSAGAGAPSSSGDGRNATLKARDGVADRGWIGPTESRLVRAHEFKGDLRDLPYVEPDKVERPEREPPEPNPVTAPGTIPTGPAVPTTPARNVPAPSTTANFDGLNFATYGNGHPPDTNGDVGPNHYIQTINTAIGIYNKTCGAPIAAFSFNTFMSQGNFGNLCDTNNFGDPVVLYDTFEDRWIITDFAFTLDGSGNINNPPGAFQCFATSKSGDPVSGGWNFFSLHLPDALGDYPKFGVWPDGLYMSANLFGFPAGSSFQGVRVWALNKAQMYAGSPTVQVISFDAPSADFTILPSNARLQAGTPPAGRPNFFVSSWEFVNALTVYKFHADWNSISLSTFTGPDTPLAASSWPNASVPSAPSLGGNNLDVLQIRAMVQNQYTNLGDVESLWAAHTVRRGDTTGFAAPRFYQVNVTGGTVAANLPQAATFDPDAGNVIFRFMPSLAVDRAGNMAIGYSTSSSTTKPAIKYAGRLSTDPINTFGQTEQVLIQGTGTQVGNCGGAPCTRWGDYSAMTLDPDGCTFWYTNEYYAVDGLDHHTRIGAFKYNECSVVGNGTLSGTVTATAGGAPINGATVTLGSRFTTTNAAGLYSFPSLPAGAYPTLTASAPGYNPSTASNIVVTAGVTTQNFSLALAPTSACLTDTTQADFQMGVGTNVDLTTSPGGVILLNGANIDQQNTAGTTTGTSFGTTSWGGQTFIPAVTGLLTRVDAELFCSGCTGTTPNLTLSVRNTTSGLPTGSDLVTATISGFSSGAGTYYTGNFSSPPTLTAGTQYALILRPVANPSPGGYFWIRSSPGTYANGQRVSSADSGATWTADSTRDFNFKTYINAGFAASGDLVSSLKDANPATGNTPGWTTLSWNASVPANTNLKFQAAASNNAGGPFSFVGPDGTAGTFFMASGASLAQFNGLRYLKYRAYLSTTDSAATPTLLDVAVCFTDSPSPPGNRFFAVTPCRVADTRNPVGPSGGPALGANTTRTFPVFSLCGIPPSATAVAVNLAVVSPSNGGDLRVYPAGATVPLASAINFRTGVVRANNAIVPLGAGGMISVQCDMPSGATNFFFDVFGYFQ